MIFPGVYFSSSKDPGSDCRWRRTVRFQGRLSGPGLAAAGRPVARPGRPSGRFRSAGAAGSGLTQLPHHQPAEGRGAGPALRLQRLQPSGPSAGHALHPPPQTLAVRGRGLAPPPAPPVSVGKGRPAAGARRVDGSGGSSAGARLLVEVNRLISERRPQTTKTQTGFEEQIEVKDED